MNSQQEIEEWDISDVGRWLDACDLGEHKHVLCDTHKLDGKCLLHLTERDLKEPPVSLPCLGKLFST